MPSSNPFDWLSDDAPSRRELVLTVVVTVLIVFQLFLAETIFWGWLVAGFLVSTVVVRPLAASSIGAQAGAWFRLIGYAGRAVVLVFFFVVVWAGLAVLSPPDGLVNSLAAGGMLGILAVATLETVLAHGYGLPWFR
ncbi:hypothetical protein OB955_12910 [Halobacteria archaeon AArc-m2/3/4]|uniref:Uncharacterized protein n=1 Tax=Natronoglomus mannanivorans TaxID=2979990 RepID=A0AAP2YYB4_9EURY|nr:hypothetical protein [Halobacteria archaeon AArc-xg1-1]MCU4973634.1 hypothetical protein [Halobacteria archaeon AArc-m2/3/4]